MTTYKFKMPDQYKDIEATDIKEAFLKLPKTQRLKFTEVHCDDTGENLSDVDVFALFGHEIAL